jgi:ribonuclease Z
VATDSGTTVEPDQVVGETRRGRKVVITGDTAPCDMVRAVGHRADLLIHEATFANEEKDRAAETGHSTALQAAEVADEAEVNLLALTHVSLRYGGGELRDEARAVFSNTIVPRDFDRVEIPFPERGAPVHVRAGNAPVEIPAPSG